MDGEGTVGGNSIYAGVRLPRDSDQRGESDLTEAITLHCDCLIEQSRLFRRGIGGFCLNKIVITTLMQAAEVESIGRKKGLPLRTQGF